MARGGVVGQSGGRLGLRPKERQISQKLGMREGAEADLRGELVLSFPEGLEEGEDLGELGPGHGAA